MQYFALLQYAWGKIDGKAAIAAAIEDGGRGGAFGAMSVLSGWATTDPESAKAWIESQEDGREKMMYMNGLVDGLAKSDPAAATAYVLSMAAATEGEGGRGGFDPRDRYIANIAGEMLKQGGIEATTAWANELPEGSLRASALSEVAQFYARQDSAAAAKWVEAYADSADAKNAVREIANRWANESPADAAKWVAGLPADSQSDAMRSVFGEWAGKQPVEASEYLATMSEGVGRDSAVAGFSRQLAGDDPSSAIEWASSIADEELRNSTELSVARRWYRDEPDAAKAWVEANLPAESQEALTQPERGGFDFGGGNRPTGGFGGGRQGGGRGGRGQ
jgi:Tfp pilus assembly major pilin PilA